MNIQRLRNITTGLLHTQMQDIYEDIDYLTGQPGVSTIILGPASKALEFYLRRYLTDERFWQDVYDPSHVGEVDIPPMDEEDQDKYFARLWARYD